MSSKRDQIKRLVRSIDHAEKRILYLNMLKRNDNCDILIRDKTNINQSQIIENGYEIINQIVYNYKQSLENYNKVLDYLLAPETTGNEQHVPSKDNRWSWRKEK